MAQTKRATLATAERTEVRATPSKRKDGSSASTARPRRIKMKAGRRLPVDEETSSEEVEQQQEAQPEKEQRYDRTRFTSAANQAWHDERVQAQAKILAEKDIDPDVETHYHLKDAFAKLGWSGSFNLLGHYYPELVREFYANVRDKRANHFRLNKIVSTVRGTRVQIHEEDVGNWLQVANEGENVDLKKSFTPPSDWKLAEALQRLQAAYKSTRKTGKQSMVTSSFQEQHRLLIYLFSNNIIPKASVTNEARTSDVYFLDQIVRGVPVGGCCLLGSIFIKHMWAVVRSNKPQYAFPYARFLTLAFQKAGVDFSGVLPKIIKPNDALGKATCRKLNVSTNFGRNLIQGERTNGAQQQDKEQEAAQEGERGEGASTSQVIQQLTGPTQVPPPPLGTRPGWRRVIDMFSCFEKKMMHELEQHRQQSMQELQRHGDRLRRIEAKLGIGAPPTPETCQANPSGEGGGEETLEHPQGQVETRRLFSGITGAACDKGPNKKLLILDLNGVLLASLPRSRFNRHEFTFRPHCFEFLEFCLSYFAVAIWSTKIWRNIEPVLESMSERMNGSLREKLFFVWDQTYCTVTKAKLRGNTGKEVMFKDLRKVWRDHDSCNVSNTLLVDDSPYKSFLNSRYSAIFPTSYTSSSEEDNYLDPKGAFVQYLKKLADADNVQEFIKQNPFGQSPITEDSDDWEFYTQIVKQLGLSEPAVII